MTTREKVVELRREGLTYRVIADRLGISLSHANRCGSPRSYESTRHASLEAKRRRRGTCERCGAETRYNGKNGGGVSRFCASCGPKVAGETLRGTGEVSTRALAMLGTPRRFTEIRDELGISNGHVTMLLSRLRRHGLIERVSRGVYRRVA